MGSEIGRKDKLKKASERLQLLNVNQMPSNLDTSRVQPVFEIDPGIAPSTIFRSNFMNPMAYPVGTNALPLGLIGLSGSVLGEFGTMQNDRGNWAELVGLTLNVTNIPLGQRLTVRIGFPVIAENGVNSIFVEVVRLRDWDWGDSSMFWTWPFSFTRMFVSEGGVENQFAESSYGRRLLVPPGISLVMNVGLQNAATTEQISYRVTAAEGVDGTLPAG